MTEERLNELIWEVVSKQVHTNTEVMQEIARELSVYFASNSSSIDANSINYQLIEETLKKRQNEILSNISHLTWSVSIASYEDTKDLYKSVGKKQLPFEDNFDIIKKTSDIEKRTRLTYSSFMDKASIMTRNSNGILIPMSIKDAIHNVIQSAKSSISAGKNKFIVFRNKLLELANSGIRIAISNGKKLIKSRRIDIALNQELNLACRDTQLGVFNVVGEQISANGVEISAHIFPAPDHAPVQGHQFTNDNFERMQSGLDFSDVEGHHYNGFERPIYGINCKHVTKPIIVGLTPQRYSEKQLQTILMQNDKGYTLSNGVHKTMYECTQIQRRLEVEIRKIKTSMLLANNVGDKDLYNKLKADLAQKISQYYLFTQQTGLPLKLERLEII